MRLSELLAGAVVLAEKAAAEIRAVHAGRGAGSGGGGGAGGVRGWSRKAFAVIERPSTRYGCVHDREAPSR